MQFLTCPTYYCKLKSSWYTDPFIINDEFKPFKNVVNKTALPSLRSIVYISQLILRVLEV